MVSAKPDTTKASSATNFDNSPPRNVPVQIPVERDHTEPADQENLSPSTKPVSRTTAGPVMNGTMSEGSDSKNPYNSNETRPRSDVHRSEQTIPNAKLTGITDNLDMVSVREALRKETDLYPKTGSLNSLPSQKLEPQDCSELSGGSLMRALVYEQDPTGYEDSVNIDEFQVYPAGKQIVSSTRRKKSKPAAHLSNSASGTSPAVIKLERNSSGLFNRSSPESLSRPRNGINTYLNSALLMGEDHEGLNHYTSRTNHRTHPVGSMASNIHDRRDLPSSPMYNEEPSARYNERSLYQNTSDDSLSSDSPLSSLSDQEIPIIPHRAKLSEQERKFVENLNRNMYQKTGVCDGNRVSNGVIQNTMSDREVTQGCHSRSPGFRKVSSGSSPYSSVSTVYSSPRPSTALSPGSSVSGSPTSSQNKVSPSQSSAGVKGGRLQAWFQTVNQIQ